MLDSFDENVAGSGIVVKLSWLEERLEELAMGIASPDLSGSQ